MAEDFGDKTEAPTPRRRQEAREQGNIARSQDLTAAALILGAMFLMRSYGPGVVSALRTLVGEMLGAKSMADSSESGALAGLLRGLLMAGPDGLLHIPFGTLYLTARNP